MKKLSRRQIIIEIFAKRDVALTCREICWKLLEEYNLTTKQRTLAVRNISGSVSSTLNKLVKDGLLKYDDEFEGPRGGYVYRRNNINTQTLGDEYSNI